MGKIGVFKNAPERLAVNPALSCEKVYIYIHQFRSYLTNSWALSVAASRVGSRIQRGTAGGPKPALGETVRSGIQESQGH